MAVYVIGDLHLSLGCDKPMDIFPGWQGYMQKLTDNWNALVRPGDTVVLAGDTSWAMKLENCGEDFAFIQGLPGRKLMLKGNHDYWWTTATKMRDYMAANGFDTLEILHNNAFVAENLALCGTRGWMLEQGQPHDAKVAAREAGRLEASLKMARQQWPEVERTAFLHYPPVYQNAESGDMVRLLQAYGVKRCYYGHLHGDAIKYAVQGLRDGVEYRLISADALKFAPLRII